MESKTVKHLLYVPFTGLGLFNGFRGNRWLKNRIAIFKQFVIPSLRAQTNQNFILWISWRREDRNNPIVEEFFNYLKPLYTEFSIIFTYSGVCFYDDKYPDEIAYDRLITAIHDSMPSLFDVLGECDEVLMTLQPSDDLYHSQMIETIQRVFVKNPTMQAAGFKKGYICNYLTKEVCEYNPNTNPPFYTIKFPKKTFIDPLSHVQYTALKKDSGKYKAGTPCPSHEYIGECLKYAWIADMRGFMVGTHGENISTTFVHPFKGKEVGKEILDQFGIGSVRVLKIKYSLRKKMLKKLPHSVQKKLRYWFGEKAWNFCYNFLRS